MYPPPPVAHVDWASLPLDTDLGIKSHVETRYRFSTGTWTAPELKPGDSITISGLSPGLNYGQQCYEGMKAMRHRAASPFETLAPSQSLLPGLRAYTSTSSAASAKMTPAITDTSVPQPASSHEKIIVFRPHFHHARFSRSAAAVCLPAPPEKLFLRCVHLAVSSNAEFCPPAGSDSFLYIRPVMFGSSAQLALAPPDEAVFAVFVRPIRPYHGPAAPGGGLDAVVLEDFDRAAPRGVGAFKLGGNYAPVWKHAARAKALGFGITLHLDSETRTKVEEFSTSGFLGLRVESTVGSEYSEGGEKARWDKRMVLVVPKTENAIHSTTSDSIIRLAELEGWIIERKELEFTSIATLSEVVAVGTAAAVVPIRSVTRQSTNTKFNFPGTGDADGIPGHLLGLGRVMADIQRGWRPDTEGWCWEVPATFEGDDSSVSTSATESMFSTLESEVAARDDGEFRLSEKRGALKYFR